MLFDTGCDHYYGVDALGPLMFNPNGTPYRPPPPGNGLPTPPPTLGNEPPPTTIGAPLTTGDIDEAFDPANYPGLALSDDEAEVFMIYEGSGKGKGYDYKGKGYDKGKGYGKGKGYDYDKGRGYKGSEASYDRAG